MRAPAVTGAERDAAAIARKPRRRARIPGTPHHHVAIERGCHRLERTAVGGHGEQARVAHDLPFHPSDEQGRAVGQPGQTAHHRGSFRHSLGRAPGGIGDVGRSHDLEVGVRVGRRRPREPSAVGRPDRTDRHRELTVGELDSLAATGVDDEYMAAAVADQADAVGFEAQPATDHRRMRGRVVEWRQREVCQPGAAGRPGEVADRGGGDDDAGLPAAERQHT